MPTTVMMMNAVRNGKNSSATAPVSSARQGVVRSVRTAPPARNGKKPTNGMPTSSAAMKR
ncbi:MAG: hypothetical protein BWX54_01675 [Verrucomicrobia bacterium ADurb.Bin018]|nr:MAG: hypothetical protein BWX54_01675 [Verrucomicrobia bacterium ADurb.Bin018]